MKITVIGTRGIPHIQGGVETHCEELYPRLVKLGAEVTVVRRSCYVDASNRLAEFNGIRLVDLFAPRIKSLEAILHSVLGVLYARLNGTDLLHVHAIGPAIVVPLARVLGLKVVMTHHGFDYRRQKWGKAARWVLKLGEHWGIGYSHRAIVISREIEQVLAHRYSSQHLRLIPNGVPAVVPTPSTSYIDSLGLQSRRFVLAAGRFVEEKGFDLLIDAFERVAPVGIALVIAGDADHESDYSRRLKQMASDRRVVLTGFVKGEALQQLFSHAALFVLPSYHEGLPIALLEAMSYRLPVLVSDIEANREVELDDNSYFRCGNLDDLVDRLARKLSLPFGEIPYSLSRYNWDSIARQVMELYHETLSSSSSSKG